MAQIYQKDGQSVYDQNGQTISATTGQALTSADLTPGANPTLSPYPTTNPKELQGTINGATQSTTDLYNSIYGGTSQTENTQNTIASELLKGIQDIQGRDAAQLTAEQQAGIPEQQKQLQELTGRLTQLQNEALAIPLQIQQDYTGRGATAGGVEPVQTASLRKNAIQSLTIGAQAQALQGNIQLAQEQVNRAVDLEFKPIEDRLEYLKTAYSLNKDILDREDTKKSQQLQIALDERSRQLEEQKNNRQGVLTVMNTVAGYGAPQSVIEQLQSARTPEEAFAIASPYMQDPAAKQALKNAQLDYTLKSAQISKTNYELQLLKQYGGMTPSEFANYQKEQNKQIAEAETEAEQARLQAQAINEKMTVIDGILNSSAIDSTVGTTAFTRPASGIGERILTFNPLGLPQAIGGALDTATGARQNLIGSVNQLISKEFLDNLISVKAQGATFGALQKAEQDALTQSASKLGTWQIKDKNDNVIGYNIDEANFRKEIENMQRLARVAYERATGEVFTNDEQALFDSLDSAGINDNPLDYYGI